MSSSAPPAIREDLTNRLIETFKDLISKGVLKPGMKLPPERDLSQRLGVSRSSLRHALKALELLGVINQRVGDGTYLNPDPSRILGAPLEFLLLVDGITELDVIDTRLIVEPELAARAANKANIQDVDRIGSILENMKRETQEDKLIELDLAFHEAIFRASGNRLATHIFSMIHRSMVASIEVTSKLVDWSHTIAFHEPIYLAIYRRSGADARKHMMEHLNDARELLLSAGGQRVKTGLMDFPNLGKQRRDVTADLP